MIAGIDYDSNGVYIVTIDEDTGRFGALARYQLDNGPGDSFDRARRVRDHLPVRTQWADAGVVAAGIEATYSQAFKATCALARVQGAILSCLPADLLVIPLQANAIDQGWKRLSVGKTTASKDEVAEWARAQGCPPAIRQDFYDAFCIAHATRVLLNREPARLRKDAA